MTDSNREHGAWLVVEDGFDAARQRAVETKLTIGNGRFGTRGSLEEGHPGDRPATLAHGIFGPHPLAFTELANLPDWTALEVIVDGERFSLISGLVIAHRRVLDLKTGLLRRTVTWRSPKGATVGLTFERFASLADSRLAAVRVTVEAVDFDGPVEVRAGLNARAETDGIAHIEWQAQNAVQRSASLGVRLRKTELRVGMAMRLDVRGQADQAEWAVHEHPTLVARWNAHPGARVTLEKTVILLTSRDVEDPMSAAAEALAEMPDHGFDALHADSAKAWRREWDLSDVIIEGDEQAQLAIRFSLYHLLIAAPRADDDVSIGAKALAGFGYRGHVFWDTETFMLPFFTHVHPEIARNLLTYRYNRLAGARRKAAAGGYEGAQFPWESADAGDEVTPKWLPDMTGGDQLIRIWTGDIEIHVSAMVAHAIMKYWDATGDDEFMLRAGAEMVIDSARFWASRAEWNEQQQRYEFSDVIGPDENHDHVDNNAFTNYMAAWHLSAAADLIEWLAGVDDGQAAAVIGSPSEAAALVTRLREVAGRIYLPRDPKTGLMEQFDGYFERQDVNLDEYRGRERSMQAILGIDGVSETQIIKQPDVLMLAYLRPAIFTAEELEANYRYYSARTDHAHGSSLGPGIQALMAARMGDVEEAYEHFMRGASADLDDVRGNAADGIHAASAGALWQALVFGFAGVRFEGAEVVTDARLPEHWQRLSFRLVHRGRVVDVAVGQPDPDAGATIRGLIFDLDGVITDTAESHYLAWQRLADEEGLPFDRAANEALRGISRRQSLDKLLNGRAVSEAQAEAMMTRKNTYYRDLIAGITPADLLPGALEVVEQARRRRLKTAIGSASKNARDVLERLQVADRFDAICDGHSVSRPKPAPDLFLAAASALKLKPAECVVFEDAADGVAAALAAGMLTVGIGPPERVGAANVVLADGLADKDLDGILRALTEREQAVA
ncbi:hypothetical protein BH24CHL7_BH24CHL7_06840 [soil metagenome]